MEAVRKLIQAERDKIFNMDGWKLAGKAEAEIEVAMHHISMLQELLVEMVNQYCRNHSDEPTTYSHDFMSTGEAVFDYLVNHGLADWAENGIDIRLKPLEEK